MSSRKRGTPPQPLSAELDDVFAPSPQPAAPPSTAIPLPATTPKSNAKAATPSDSSLHPPSATAEKGAGLRRDLPLDAFGGRIPSSSAGHSGGERKRSRPKSEPGLPERGAVVDKYRLEELLGVGGFAAVYRATHLMLQTEVAIKLVRPTVLSRRPALAERLRDEARLAARINHPNVVRVYDVTHTPKLTFVVMELIKGPTLAQRVEQAGPVPPAQVIKIGLEVCAGLAAGLERGVVHRDIKPANIVLDERGTAKIVDLGLAVLDLGGEHSEAGTRAGTPGFIAPEQADGKRADFRGDIYSLGVTLFYAATGRLPMRARRDLEAPNKSTPEIAVENASGLPPALASLFVAMLSANPMTRPASYDVLQQELNAAAATLPRV